MKERERDVVRGRQKVRGRMQYVVLYRLLYLAQTFPFKLFINIIFYSSRERESKRNWKK